MITTVRVGGVPEHFNLPWRLAVDGGAFRAAGIAVRYSEHPGGTGELTRALREGDLDVALVLTEGAVADVIGNDSNRLVKVVVDSPLVWGIHVAATSEIEELDSIRGRRFAISRYGSGSHLIAIMDAAERGWPTRHMSFVVVDDIDGARRALSAGDAEVFLWERHMTQPLVDAGEFRRIGQRVVPWPAFVASARREFLASDAGAVRTMLEIAATAAINLKRRKTAPRLIADTCGIRLSEATEWLAQVRWGASFRPPIRALRRVTDALRAQGVADTGRFAVERIWHRL